MLVMDLPDKAQEGKLAVSEVFHIIYYMWSAMKRDIITTKATESLEEVGLPDDSTVQLIHPVSRSLS